MLDNLCKDCPKQKNGFVPPQGSPESRFWVIGMAPGPVEVQAEKPFSGPSGNLLNLILHKVGIDRSSIYIDNVCRCFCSPGQSLPSGVASLCVNHVKELIKEYKPRIVVLLGDETNTYVLGNKRDLHTVHGVPYHWFSDDTAVTFISTFHPARILRESVAKQAYLKVLLADFVLAKKLFDNPIKQEVFDPSSVIFVNNISDLERYFDLFISSEKPVAFDFETTAIKPYFGDIVTMAFSNGNLTIAFCCDDFVAYNDKFQAILRRFFNSSITKVAHRLQFETEWLFVKYGILPAEYFDDTMLLAFYVRPQPLSLKDLAHSYLKAPDWGIDVSDLSKYSREELLLYNAADAFYTNKLYTGVLRPWFDRVYPEGSSFRYTYENWARQVPVYVAKAQADGILVDTSFLDKLERDYKLQLKEVLKVLYKHPILWNSLEKARDLLQLIPGDDIFDKLVWVYTIPKKSPNAKLAEKVKKAIFNVASSKQLAEFLKTYLKCDLPVTSKGNLSVDESVLKKHSSHPFVENLLRLRGILKNLSTYIVNIRKYLDSENKLHTDYNQLGTTTSRFSSSNPNLQNWPKRKGKTLRNIFTVPKGKLWVRFDAKALEVTVLQMYAKDPVLGDYLHSGGDMHYDTSLELFSTPEKAKAERNRVKNKMVFPVFYGAGFSTVRSGFPDLPEEKVKKVYDNLKKKFSKVVEWQQKVWRFYCNHGYIEALHGYRRWMPMNYNAVINAPIQGFAAFLLWSAWVDLLKKGYWCPIYVHDELNIIIDDNEEALRRLIKDIYDVTVKRNFKILKEYPIDIEVEIGYSWGNLKSINYQDYL